MSSLYPALYVWYPTSKSYSGHIALCVSPETYISFWPVDVDGATFLMGTVPSRSHTFQLDCILEGSTNDDEEEIPRYPDDYIKINSPLKEEDIKKWWQEYQESGFNVYSQNCVHAIIDALAVGLDDVSEFERLGNEIFNIYNVFRNCILFNITRQKSSILC